MWHSSRLSLKHVAKKIEKKNCICFDFFSFSSLKKFHRKINFPLNSRQFNCYYRGVTTSLFWQRTALVYDVGVGIFCFPYSRPRKLTWIYLDIQHTRDGQAFSLLCRSFHEFSADGAHHFSLIPCCATNFKLFNFNLYFYGLKLVQFVLNEGFGRSGKRWIMEIVWETTEHRNEPEKMISICINNVFQFHIFFSFKACFLWFYIQFSFCSFLCNEKKLSWTNLLRLKAVLRFNFLHSRPRVEEKKFCMKMP